MLERLIRRWFVPAVAALSLSCSGSSSSPEEIIEDAAPEVAVSPCGDYKCEPYRGENCTTCPEDCDICRGLCEPCADDYQCGDGSGKDLCVSDPTSLSLFYNKKGVCGKDCSVEACPQGYDCIEVFSQKERANVKQCVSTLFVPGLPTCVIFETCDPNQYPSKCEDGKSYECSNKYKLVKVTDCQYHGLNCGFSNFYKENVCFGNSLFGEPCPVWYDCDLSKMNACISVGDGLSTYCTITCNTDSDCPQNYHCGNLDDGNKACIKN